MSSTLGLKASHYKKLTLQAVVKRAWQVEPFSGKISDVGEKFVKRADCL